MQTTWIREKRENLKISQYKMAKAIGVPSYNLSAWELNKDAPTNEDVLLLNDFFKNHNDYFLKKGISRNKRKFERIFSKPKLESKYNQKDIIDDFYKKNQPPDFKIDKDRKAIMLFSGIGGMSLGFKQAGYNLVGHVELNQSANKIYKLNFPESVSFGTDIRDISDDEIKQIKNEFGEIAIIAGGPPCQGFSLAGKRSIDDSRNQLFKEFVRFTEIIQPKAILFENVRTLLSMQSEEGKLVRDFILESFNKVGYMLEYKAINAKQYGVPQSRERVIFIGLKKDLCKKNKLVFPTATHGKSSNTLFDQGLDNIKTFRTATSDLESLESGEASNFDPWHFAIHHPKHVVDMLKQTPEGKSAHENQDPNMRPNSGYNTTYKRIRWNEPSSTISTNFSMISGSRNVHPSNTRSLTIREAMRCQTFPDYFLLNGSLGDIRTGIGNAVPPALAKFMADYLKVYIDS